MKKSRLYLFLLSFLFLFSSQAQTLPGPLYTARLDAAIAAGGTLYAFDSYSSAMYISSNNGVSWISKTMPSNNYFVTDAEPAGTDVFIGVYSLGIIKYSTTTQTFTTITSGLPAYPSVSCIAKNSNNDLYISVGTSLYKLANGSTTWTSIPKPNIGSYYLDIYFNGSEMWVSTNGAGIFKTSNDGLSWSSLASTPLIDVAKSFVNIGGTIYTISNMDIYKSTDGGVTWTSVSNGITTPNIYSLSKLTSDGTNLIVTGGNPAFMYTSANGGSNWTLTGPTNGVSISGTISDGAGTLLGYGIHGMYKSLDHGATWTSSSTGMTSFTTKGIITNGTTIYINTQYSGLYKSTDNGATWTLCYNGLQGDGGPLYIYGSYIYAINSFYVYRSADQGATWTSANLSSYSAGQVNAINGVLYVASMDGLYSSTNYGNTWTQLSTLAINKICGDAYGNLFAMSFPSGTYGDAMVYISTDGGVTWAQYKNKFGAYQMGVQSIAVCNNILYSGGWNGVYKYGLYPNIAPTKVYDAITIALTVNGTALYAVGSLDYGVSYSGLFKTLNNGTSWTFVGGPPSSILAITIANSIIYMGTKFSPNLVTGFRTMAVTGVARVSADPDQSNITPSSVELYPNPATDYATIKTIDEIRGLSVVNAQGEIVFTDNPVGNNEYELALTALQKGVYMIKVTTLSGQETLKLVKE